MAKGKPKNPTNRNQDHSASSEPSTPSTASPGYPNTPRGWFNIWKFINAIHYINKLQQQQQKKTKPMIISLYEETAFVKIQHSLMISLGDIKDAKHPLITINAICSKSIDNIKQNREK